MNANKHPKTDTKMRETLKRQTEGKAGRVGHKGGAPTSNKGSGGKMAR